MTYTCLLEKAGIPCVNLGFPDQINFARNVALVNGVPNVRWVDSPRTGTGEQRVATVYDKVIKAMTEPLTAKEKESGLYTPPPPPRIIFEGTLDDAQEFFAQTTPIENCRKCPIAKYTDGLPIIIPTEEKVKEMLTGTSHQADEEIYRYTRDTATGTIKKGTSPVLYARGYKSTVEKVATIAVMAGCKPEYMPVVLTIATTGGGSTSCPGTSSAFSNWYVVSGPIAKEIGMNSGQGALDVGSIPNMTIGRVGALMTINFGGCIQGSVRTDAGNFVHSVAFAEDVEGLPPGWEGFNEEGGYKKTESCIGKGSGTSFTVQEYAPSSFRGLIGAGYGGMAKRIGVEGTPGPHNFLEYVAPLNITSAIGGHLFIMHPNMAISLYDYGFKKKADVYQWLLDTYWITVGEYEAYGWFDHSTDQGRQKATAYNPVTKEPMTASYNDLPDNYLLHAMGSSITSNCIIVSIGFNDELCYHAGGRPSSSPIDVWR